MQKYGWSNFSENLRIVELKVLEINLQLFTLILYGFEVICDLKAIFSAQSICREVYGQANLRPKKWLSGFAKKPSTIQYGSLGNM